MENIQKHLVEVGEKVAAGDIPLNQYEIHKVRMGLCGRAGLASPVCSRGSVAAIGSD